MALVFFIALIAGTAPDIAKANLLEKFAHQPLNALASEASPYLRQHSRDLVKWNSWNKATLERALKSGKPLFVSIGYSACHWCHVMQEESFNNAEIAKLLNENFTPILIDREQRPDLDETYMLATEAISGQGGWPNNVLLTPDLKPFYGGVYFPPADYIKLLTLIATDWAADKATIELEAERISTILTSFFNRKSEAKELSGKVVNAAVQKLIAQFDSFNGGMGTAPKHFNAPALSFLFHMADKPNGAAAKKALLTTLRAIANGGVRDHLAGGFHRYATDNNWRIPHFEKMLYDQALLAELFTKASSLTGDPFMEQTARSTLDYVLADLTAPQGGFYSTRDADSAEHKGGNAKEGTFYVWTPEQLTALLGKADAEFMVATLGSINEGEFAGKIILHRDVDFDKAARQRFERVLKKLHTERQKRIAPHRDTKIIASWNGLMISAFAIAGQHFSDQRYATAATKAAEFIWSNMRDKNGNLLRNFFENKAGIISTLPDYAFVARAFIDTYDLTGNEKWLQRAEQMAAKLDSIFKDKAIGDYFFTASKQGYARIKLRGDTALPSGNGVALEVFEKLSRRSLDPKYSRRTEAIIAALSGDAVADPKGGATTLASAGRFLRGQTTAMQYAARGRVKVKASLDKAKTRLRVHVTLAPQWHVNANKPFEADFIPTALSLKTIDGKASNVKVNYPKTISRKLGFNDKPLALYENRFDLTIPLGKPATSTITANLTLQACNDEVCLIPETLTLKVTPKASPKDAANNIDTTSN